jgi:hypothetical protein
MTDTIHDVTKIAQNMDATLRADDERFDRAILIVHQEGTVLFYQNGFAEPHGDWWMIFAEHHKAQVYHSEDLIKLIQYNRINDLSYETFTGVVDV